MRIKKHGRAMLALIVLAGLASTVPALAQDGKLKFNVYPPETYVFVDGQAMGVAHHTMTIAPGDHQIGLYNYGFKPVTQSISVSAGKTSTVEAKLERVSDAVSGPFGAITIEGAAHDAVFLNGKTPDYFVGHGDEFNHEWWWKQELVVPPGQHQLTIVKQGKEIWSGTVNVAANQRVVVDIPLGVKKTVPWPRGEQIASSPRFLAGISSARVVIAKPVAQLLSERQQINCGEGAQLKWSTSDAGQVDLTPIGTVAGSGEQSVQPKETTTYQLRASGPGGTAVSSTTVTVSNAIQAQLALAPSEVRYRRVGNKVMEEGTSALNWTVSNADKVEIDPLGSVNPNGNQSLQIAPTKKDVGAVDETVTYTLTASNACGGTDTKTATLHVVGSIEPEPEVALSMRSLYFPTDLPKPRRLESGLLGSEKQALITVADAFKKYLADHPDARLALIGHADARGPSEYNRALSERRAEAAKAFLVQQGVPAANVDTQGLGEEQGLNAAAVTQLLEQNPDLNAEARERALQRMATIVFAHNRRVDIHLSTTGQQSVRNYPFTADDYAALVRRGPEMKEAIVPAAQRERINGAE